MLMTLSPLLEASPIVQFHAISATVAFLLGPIIFYRRKGTPLHKRLGKLWVLAMGVAIISSAFIWEIRLIGLFSPIHLLTILGGWGLGSGINHAIQGRISAHEASMKGLYFWALGAAGVFTFMPGRVMSEMVFPEHSLPGFYTVLGIYIVALLAWRFTAARSRDPKQANRQNRMPF